MAIKTVSVLINGTTTTLTYNSGSGKYEGTITAPAKSSHDEPNGSYPVSVTAEDTAGNKTTKSSADGDGVVPALYVRSTNKPVIEIVSPTAGAILSNNAPNIVFKVTGTDAGVNVEETVLKVDGQAVSGVTHTSDANVFTFTYTPSTALADGGHTIEITAEDNDGNAAVTASASFTVDTVPPTLNITQPTQNLVTKNASLIVAGTTNDVTSSPVTVTVNGDSVTVNDDGSFSTTITLTEGTNNITVIATDKAGKQSTVTRTVTLDSVAPNITAVTIEPNPVDAGQTFVISVTVTD